MPRRSVDAPAVPDTTKAVGPYSHAASAPGGDLLLLSSETPIDPQTWRLVAGDVAAQTQQVFANVTAALEAAGRTVRNVVKVNMCPRSMDEFEAMNAAYAEAFTEPWPARTTVAVAGLPPRSTGGDRSYREPSSARRSGASLGVLVKLG